MKLKFQNVICPDRMDVLEENKLVLRSSWQGISEAQCYLLSHVAKTKFGANFMTSYSSQN